MSRKEVVTVVGCTTALIAAIPAFVLFYPIGLLYTALAVLGPFGTVVQMVLLFCLLAS